MFKCNCGSYKTQQRILKATSKAGSKAMREANIIQGIARSMETGVVRQLRRGIKNFKNRISISAIEAKVRDGKFDEILATIPFDKLQDDIDIREPNEKALVRAGNRAASIFAKNKVEKADVPKLPPPPPGLRLDTENPAVKRFIDGEVGQLIVDERGNFIVRTDEKDYGVLLASVTFYKAEEGDEVTILLPENGEAEWGAVENVIHKQK